MDRLDRICGQCTHDDFDVYLCPLHAAAPDFKTWILNVATDSQLDAPVPALGGRTMRAILRDVEGESNG